MSAHARFTFEDLKKLNGTQLDQIGYSVVGGNTGATLSPYILGLFMDAMLLGVVLMQFNRWIEYCHPNESWRVRILVYYVIVLNLAITIFLITWNFDMFVYGFGRYRQFVSVDYASFFYLIDALVRFPVSIFFAERAWRMTGQSKILAVVLSILILACVAMGITAKVLATKIFGAPEFIALTCAWLGCHLAADAVITTTIGVCLWRSKTGWKQTDAIVIQLLVMTAETSIPPTILSLSFLVIYAADTGTAWPIFFVFSAKVFAICLIAVLNTKFTLRRELETQSAIGGNNTYALRSRGKQPTLQVQVVTETYRERDDYNNLDDPKRSPGDVESESAGRYTQKENPSLSDMDFDDRRPSVPVVRFN